MAAFWDVAYLKKEFKKSHYRMKETKERILDLIAKN